MIEPVTSTTDASPTPPPAEPREAPATRRWHYWAAGAAAVLVALCTATVVALQPEAPPVPSRSEIALRSAHDDAARLTAATRASLEQAAAAELAPAARAALAAAATVLGRQADVLGQATASQSPSSPPTSGSAGTTPAGSTAAGTNAAGTTPAGISPAGLLTDLSASAQARLADVPDVDGPTATILASVAAGQVLQAEAIAAAAGLHAPALPGPAAATPADPTPAACPSPTRSAAPSATPTPAPAKPGAASAETNSAGTTSAGTSSTGPLARPAERLAFPDAIAAVARAESAAVYASQTALARSAAGSSEAAARANSLDAHRQQLKAVESLAARACVGLPVPDAGFALPSGFAADPTPGLAAVAASGEESWAQLVGAAPAELRAWAADGLLVAARLGTGGTPFPGVPSAG